jgi:hypothetical protein
MNVATGKTDADAAAFVERCHRALRQHTSGNPRPYLDLWSDADDVSLMGGVGGRQVGLEQVTQLLTAAAKTLELRDLGRGEPRDRVRRDARFHGRAQRLRTPRRRRVGGDVAESNDVYRRESGAWRVIHRHGDGLTERRNRRGGPLSGGEAGVQLDPRGSASSYGTNPSTIDSTASRGTQGNLDGCLWPELRCVAARHRPSRLRTSTLSGKRHALGAPTITCRADALSNMAMRSSNVG